MGDERQRLGSSGIFKIIVDGAKKISRAVTESDVELSHEANELAVAIAQAFIAGRFADVHALGTPPFQERTSADAFAARWRTTVGDRTLTGFSVTDAGHIDLAFIPGLEDASQDDFAGFAQISFSVAAGPSARPPVPGGVASQLGPGDPRREIPAGFSTPEVKLEDERAFAIAAVLLDHDGRIRLGALHAR